MKNQSLAIAAILLAGLSVAACTRTAADLPPGKYESTSSHTDATGTSTENRNTTTVTYDEYGNKKAVVEDKKTTDPKGLFNKNTTETKQVIQK